MAKRIWFRPAPGLSVPRDPLVERGVMFPPGGDWAMNCTYLQRRLRDGSGEIFDAMPVDAPEPPPEPAAVITTDQAIAAVTAAATRFRRSTRRTPAAAATETIGE